jgi:hypothetical protein
MVCLYADSDLLLRVSGESKTPSLKDARELTSRPSSYAKERERPFQSYFFSFSY